MVYVYLIIAIVMMVSMESFVNIKYVDKTEFAVVMVSVLTIIVIAI